jgi:hypothetical protein
MYDNSNETDNSINYYICSENYWLFWSFENVGMFAIIIMNVNESSKSIVGCVY